MSNLSVDRKSVAPSTAPIFTGPVRWMAAAVLVIGPLLQVIEFLTGDEADDNAARVAFWAAHPAQTGLSMASGLLAIPFLLGASVILVALTQSYSRRLAWAGGIFMTFGMTGLAAAHGYELAAFGLTLSGNLPVAATVLNGDTLGIAGIVLFIMFLGGVVLGSLTIAIAAWRSPLVPRIVVVFMVAFAILDFAVGQGDISHLVNLAGFIILAVAVVNGYLRQPVAAKTRETQPG